MYTVGTIEFKQTFIVLYSMIKSNRVYTIHIWWLYIMFHHQNNIGGVMVSVLASSAVDRWFEPRSGQTKDYNIFIFASPLGTQY
jgi:hypothetical protein